MSTKPQDVADSTAKAKKLEKTLRQRLNLLYLHSQIFLESQNEYEDIFSSRFSPTSLRSPDTEKKDPIVKLEAERKLQELKRRRNEMDSEVLEKMKQKQQTAEAELEELKKKREERRKILEEEEKQKKQQLGEKKAKEEVKKESSLGEC